MAWWNGSEDERFWIYLAAIIDGEGCIGIYPQKRYDSKNPRRPALKPYVSITNTDMRLLDAIKDTIPNQIYVHIRKPHRKESIKRQYHKDSFTVFIANYASVQFVINKVMPYLILKKERGQLVLDFIKLRFMHKEKKGYYTLCGDDVYAIYKKVRDLNRKGKSKHDNIYYDNPENWKEPQK